MGAKITQDVVLESSRCLNMSAWNSGGLYREGYPNVDPVLHTFLPLSLKYPVFAAIRTNRAVFGRAKIIHESRDELRVSFLTINRKGGRETKTDVIKKEDIRSLRVYKD